MDFLDPAATALAAILGGLIAGWWTSRTAKQGIAASQASEVIAQQERLRRDSLESAKELLGIFKDMKREFMTELGKRPSPPDSRRLHMSVWSEERSRTIAQETLLLTNSKTRRRIEQIDRAFEDLYVSGVTLNSVSLQTCVFLASDGYNVMAHYIRGEAELPPGNPGFQETEEHSARAGLRASFRELD